MQTSCFLVFLALSLVNTARGAEFFVDARATGQERRDGSAAHPWPRIADGVARLEPGDVLSIRPGVYPERQVRITQNRVRLRRDPATPGTVVIDGGVSLPELQNRDMRGRQKTSDNGPSFRPAVEVSGKCVTLEDLEVRNGFLGISMRGERGAVLRCHVHHLGQHGIEITADGGRVEDCLVHDANLYNVNGQCLAGGREVGTGRPDQNTRKKIRSPDPNRHGKNMDWGQGITFHGEYRGAWAPHGCVIRGNTVWNIWGEGIATYNASGVRMENNVALNVWRMAYYVQNADLVVLDGNLALYTRDFRALLGAGAMAVCYSFANEYPADHLRIAGGARQPLVPDGSVLDLLKNISWRGDYALHSGDRHPIGTRGGIAVRGNLFLLPAFAPCININASLIGPVRVGSNVLGRSGADPEDAGRFLSLAGGNGAVSRRNRFVCLGEDGPQFVRLVDEAVHVLLGRAENCGPGPDADLRPQIELLRRQFSAWAGSL